MNPNQKPTSVDAAADAMGRQRLCLPPPNLRGPFWKVGDIVFGVGYGVDHRGKPWTHAVGLFEFQGWTTGDVRGFVLNALNTAAGTVSHPIPLFDDDAPQSSQDATKVEDPAGTSRKPNPIRPAKSDVEKWAARALAILSANDPDGASVINGAGFNKTDGDFGHSLADFLSKRGGLTEKQWVGAVKICRKYHKQVGEPPADPIEVETRAGEIASRERDQSGWPTEADRRDFDVRR